MGAFFSGADDEIRTRDLNLGKVALYQLSYIRILFFAGCEVAENEIRTRDLNLGPGTCVGTLYQLSYIRICLSVIVFTRAMQI